MGNGTTTNQPIIKNATDYANNKNTNELTMGCGGTSATTPFLPTRSGGSNIIISSISNINIISNISSIIISSSISSIIVNPRALLPAYAQSTY